MSYDSTKDTLEHIKRVSDYMGGAAIELIRRGALHDASKLQEPEKSYFDKETPILSGLVYGSEEYRESTRRLKPALDHHYANNSHHPQFYEDGINGMNLFDLIEMFLDWKASSERTKNGDMRRSIDINAERYGMSKQLRQIFINTLQYL